MLEYVPTWKLGRPSWLRPISEIDPQKPNKCVAAEESKEYQGSSGVISELLPSLKNPPETPEIQTVGDAATNSLGFPGISEGVTTQGNSTRQKALHAACDSEISKKPISSVSEGRFEGVVVSELIRSDADSPPEQPLQAPGKSESAGDELLAYACENFSALGQSRMGQQAELVSSAQSTVPDDRPSVSSRCRSTGQGPDANQLSLFANASDHSPDTNVVGEADHGSPVVVSVNPINPVDPCRSETEIGTLEPHSDDARATNDAVGETAWVADL